MKLTSFVHKGRTSYGIVEQNQVWDIGHVIGERFSTLRSLIGARAFGEAHNAAHQAPAYQFEDVTFLPVITDPSKILCVGINYATHIEETGRPYPTRPMIFVRFPESHVGHEQAMVRPRESVQFDFEGELAVVIGKGGRRISREKALEHVAGYSCYNDGSIRDWQRHSTQFTPGKNFPRTGAVGPWLTTSDEVTDPSSLAIETRLNGNVMQSADISDLVFDVPALIEYCSAFSTLEPGDIIATGTAGGVGAFRDPPVWLRAGDVVEVEITAVGKLRNPVREEEPG